MPLSSFHLLGPVTVERDGQRVALDGEKLRALLALLLVDVNHVVSADRLLEALWPDEAPQRANSLQALVSRLRRSLGDTEAITFEEPGYRLRADEHQIDARRFEALLHDAHAMRERGAEAEAAALLEDALGLWRGEALADAGTDERTEGERTRLEELRLRALEERVDADLTLGRHAELVPQLQALTAEHPLREHLHGQLMIALYRCGRQADALEAHRATRRRLVEELGVEPGPELRQLERMILTHDPALAPAAHLASFGTNLPASVNALIGREREIAEVREALLRPGVRMLTLVGPGGVGKTRLALEAATGIAEAFPSGTVLVDLAPLTDPAVVAPALAHALNVPAPSMAQLADRLARDTDAALLLVLDSVERVASVAPELGELLAAVPGLSVLVTSRVALRIAAEHVLPLQPLDEDEAVALFVERARASAGPATVARDDLEVVRAVCRRLDGLPLAIELAAEGSRLLDPSALLSRLGRRLAVPASGRLDLPQRQRSLRATLDWSWELLEPVPRALLTRLGVFAGGATLDAVDAVCNPDGELGDDTLALASELLTQAAVRRLDTRPDEPARLGMLDTVREYAEERAADTGELGELRRRHATYFLEFAEEAAAHTGTMQRRAWLESEARERDNVRTALGFFMGSGEIEAALRLAIAFARALPYDAHAEDVQGRLAPALDASDPAPYRLRAAGLHWSGRLAISRSDYPHAQARLDACVELVGQLGDASLEADARGARGLAATMVGDPGARGWCEGALAAARAAGDARRIAAALSLLAGAYERDDALTDARALSSESLALYRETRDPDGIARTLNDLGWYALLDGDLDRAEELIEESMDIRRRRGDEREIAETLANRGWLALLRDQPDDAGRRFDECFELARHVDDRFEMGECIGGLSAVAAARGEHALAALLLGAEQAAHEQLGAPPWESVDLLREPRLAGSKAALGAAEWAAAVADGRALPPEEAAARARAAARSRAALPW